MAVTSTENGTTGIADLSAARARLRVTGADRVAFLHGQCTNEVKKLVAGQSCYAAFLTAKGKMRGEGEILCLPDAFLLETSLGLAPSLEKFIITEDVLIEDVSASSREWLVVGDAGVNVPADAVTFTHPLGTGVISREQLKPTLSGEALEVLRVEAAVPKWGADMDENTIPNEAGLEKRAMSYDKGCYIGQETIARIKTYGHVNRQLVQLAIESQAGMPVPPVPTRGDKLFAGEREVGQVTSVVFSTRLGKPLALGYVRREFAETGTKLTINQRITEVVKVCGA
jgi:folate-binding protein YgfZ